MKKRRRADITGYGPGEKIDSDLEDEEMRSLGKAKDSRSKSQDPVNKFKAANPNAAPKKRDQK